MVDQTPVTNAQSAAQSEKAELKLAEKALSKAKVAIVMSRAVFLSTILFSVYHILDPTVPTACTDGLTIKYNTKWFMSLDEEERIGLMLHEAWHIAFCHMIRSKDLDHELHNRAADHVINIMLIDAGYKIPDEGCCDFKYRNWTTKEVYNDLMLTDPKTPPDYVPDLRKLGSETPTENQINNPKQVQATLTAAQTAAHEKASESKIKSIVVAAQAQSKAMNEKPGNIPGEIARTIDELINPKLDYTDLLSRYMCALAKSDYTWTRPNKNFMPDFYMPSQQSEGMGHIGFAFDTSGSISKAALKALMSEAQHIIDEFKPEKVTAIDCDKKIHNIHVLDDPTVDLLTDVQFSGGGGTSFVEAIAYFEEDPPDILIYFTDLCGRDLEQEPSYPLIWLCWSNHAPSAYGETIYYHE